MGIKLNAAKRLLLVRALNTNLDAPNGQYGGDGIGEPNNTYEVVDAAFDNSKDQSLGELVAHLKHCGLNYTLKDSCLFCKIPSRKGVWLSKQTVRVLQELGITLYIRDDMLVQPQFALKGPDGLVYQRLDQVHRIFYTR